MAEKKSIFICAGDPSGDIAGYHLIRELKLQAGHIDIFGLGGKRMFAEGQRQIVDGDRLAVLGFWEVAKKYFFFRKLMYETVAMIKNSKPAAIILIDYPGFNLSLAKRIKYLNIPIIYYISPQIWAWAPQRIHKIKKLINHMLVILPFESGLYNKAGIKNDFVGHYLFDDLENKFIKTPYNVQSDLITLMPGSRPQEIERMLPVLVRSAELLNKTHSFRYAIAALDNNVDYARYIAHCSVPIEIKTGMTRQLIADSRIVLTSSGTATLETGIIGRPMVVIYKTGFLTYLIARCLVRIKNIALINIASGKTVVPELIQLAANPEKITAAALRFIDDNELTQATIRQLNETTDRLGGAGTGHRAARIIGEYLS